MKYDVFISYSRKDSEVVNEITECLEENKISCFVDRDGISGGEEFSPILAEHIKASTVFLFIGSKNSYASKWTSKELHFALKNKDEDAIIPYIIDDEILPEKIDIVLSDINIRNIKEHPIKDRLLEDIKKALEKLSPKNAKEDIGMAKSISEQIIKSAHSLDDNLQLLMELGKINSSRRFDRLSESEVYYSKAIELYERAKTNELSNDKQYYYIYYHLAKIKKEKEQYSDAEKLYQKYIDLMASISNNSPSRKADIIDGVIDLAEVQCFLGEYDSSCNNCEKAQKMMASFGIEWDTINKARRLLEIQVRALQKQGKNEEAASVQDHILGLFRNQPANELTHTSFSDLLVAFAQFSRKNNQLETTKTYLEEAYERDDNNMDIVLDLAQTYEALEMKTEAFDMYKKAFSIGIKQNDSSSFIRRGLEGLLDAIVPFFDKNGYYKEIEKFFELTISKYQVDIYNGIIKRGNIGNIYKLYSDWLLNRKRYSEAKRYLNDYIDMIDLNTDNVITFINYFRVRCKIASIYHGLKMEEKAHGEVNDAIRIIKESKVDLSLESFYFLETVLSVWNDFNTMDFLQGADLVKSFLVNDFCNIKLDTPNDQVNYYTNYGWCMLLMEEYEVASKPLTEALKMEEKLKRDNGIGIANAKNNLARLYIHTKQFDKAEKLLKEACAFSEKLAQKEMDILPNLAESQNYFGQLHEAKEEYAKAETYYEQSLCNYRKAIRLNDFNKRIIKSIEKSIEEITISVERVKAMQE